MLGARGKMRRMRLKRSIRYRWLSVRFYRRLFRRLLRRLRFFRRVPKQEFGVRIIRIVVRK